MHTIDIYMPFHPFVMVMMLAYPAYLIIRAAWRSVPLLGG